MRANKAIKLLTDLNDWVDVWVATGVQVIELQGVVDFVLDSDCKTRIEEMEALPRLNQRSVVAAHAGKLLSCPIQQRTMHPVHEPH